MENNKKHIAAIFEEQSVFMTFSGDCYSYAKEQGAFRCHKMNKLSQKLFWENYRRQAVDRQDKMMSWQPVAFSENRQAGERDESRQGILMPSHLMSRYREKSLSN